MSLIRLPSELRWGSSQVEMIEFASRESQKQQFALANKEWEKAKKSVQESELEKDVLVNHFELLKTNYTIKEEKLAEASKKIWSLSSLLSFVSNRGSVSSRSEKTMQEELDTLKNKLYTSMSWENVRYLRPFSNRSKKTTSQCIGRSNYWIKWLTLTNRH